jgi:hypothetical protein
LALGQDNELPAQPEPVGKEPPADVLPPPSSRPTPSVAPEKPVISETSCHFTKFDFFSLDYDAPDARPWHGENAEYLVWWLKKGALPPLVTQSLPGFLPSLNMPNTRILLADKLLDQEEHSGGRFTLAESLVEYHGTTTLGLEGTYFFLGTRTDTFLASGSGAPGTAVIGRPFVDANTGQELAFAVAAPHLFSGSVAVAYSARMQGAELNGVGTVHSTSRMQLDGLIGFRYLELDEGVNVAEELTPLTVPVRYSFADQFDGHNRFYGGQLGARFDMRRAGFFANFLGKVALGESYEVTRIGGVTVTTPTGGVSSPQPGGLLALSTNSGRFVREAFAVVPELGIKLGYHMSDHARFFVGYTFVYLSDVTRPGDQIDRVVNVSQVPLANPAGGPLTGVPRPEAPMHSSDFWTHGLSLGMEFRY